MPSEIPKQVIPGILTSRGELLSQIGREFSRCGDCCLQLFGTDRAVQHLGSGV